MKKIILFTLLTLSISAFSQEKELPFITVNAGSFIYHVIPTSKGNDYTQFFDNQYLSIGVRLSKRSYASFGTTLNSFGDRMVVIGLKTNLYTFSKRIHLEGFYAYAGEFFFDAFSHAGDRGFYSDFKDKTGVGFAPYIYHGIDIKLNSFLTIEAGFILPIIPVVSLQIDLFPAR